MRVTTLGALVLALTLAACGSTAPTSAPPQGLECSPNPVNSAWPWVETEDLDDTDGDAPDECVQRPDGMWVPTPDGGHKAKAGSTHRVAKATKATKSTRRVRKP